MTLEPAIRPAAANATTPRLRRLDAAWFARWTGHLDPRRHPSVSGAAIVSSLLRHVPIAGRVEPALSGGPSVLPRSMPSAARLAATSRRGAEVLAALSSGLDAAERRAPGHAIRTAYASARLAAGSGLTEPSVSDLLYAGLLRDAGTTGRAPDETPSGQAAGAPVAEVTLSTPHLRRMRVIRPGSTPTTVLAHLSPPDRAVAAVRALGLPQGVASAVSSAGERWDGRGPKRVARDAIPMAARLLAVASAMAEEAAGARDRPQTRARDEQARAREAEHALRRRSARELDPALVDLAVRLGREGLWRHLISPDLPERLLELEPVAFRHILDDDDLDAVCATFADIVDTRTPRLGRHGARVADLSERVAAQLGFDANEGRELRRAGLLHDVGKLLVPIAYLEKGTDLTDAERRAVDEHVTTSGSILAGSRVLAGLVPLILGHHEPLDGTGRFPRVGDERLALAARVIALCDRFESRTAERTGRPRAPLATVMAELDLEVKDPLAIQALHALRRTLTQT